MSVNFDPHLNIPSTEIVLVGLGGTGSALAKHIGRIVFQMKSQNIQMPKSIKFIDPDVVEEKNIGRQSFVFADIGQYKAEIMARRLNAALGLNIQFFNERFDAAKHLDKYSSPTSTVVIGAVDNHLARRELTKANAVWIDCGNRHNSGQVTIGTTSKISVIEEQIRYAPTTKDGETESWKHLPNAALTFPAILEPEPPEERSNIIQLSCADLVLRGEQHILINDQMAVIAANYLHKLLYRERIETFITHYDGDLMSMRSVRITHDEITERLKEAV